MKQNETNIKNKIINNLTLNGKKDTSNKIVLKSLKQLQKNSLKQSKKLINLSFILTTPIFKIHKIIKKRKKKKKKSIIEFPVLINSNKSKLSSAVKFFLSTLQTKNSEPFYTKFYTEILSNIQNENSSVKFKNSIQKQALTKKHVFYYYK
jgi:ribosomal protein S7